MILTFFEKLELILAEMDAKKLFNLRHIFEKRFLFICAILEEAFSLKSPKSGNKAPNKCFLKNAVGKLQKMQNLMLSSNTLKKRLEASNFDKQY